MMDVKVKVYTRDKAPDFNQNRPGVAKVDIYIPVPKKVTRLSSAVPTCSMAGGWETTPSMSA